MKKLDLSPIAIGTSMYVKGGTLAFVQLAYQEAVTEIITSRIGPYYDVTLGYILNGCVNSGSGSNYIISAGSVLFNGEIYLVDAATFTISGSNVAVGVITTTQYVTDADPTDFTDGVQRNVHDIRKIVFQQGLSGSGAFDFVDAVNLTYKPVGAIGQTTMWIMPGSGSQNTLLATYFDAATFEGIHPLTFGWIIDSALKGHVAAGYKPIDAIYGTIGDNKGADTYQIAAADLPVLATGQDFATTGGSTVQAYIKQTVSSSALVAEPVNPGSANTPISLMQKTVIRLYITRYA